MNGGVTPEEPKTPPVVIASPEDIYDGQSMGFLDHSVLHGLQTSCFN